MTGSTQHIVVIGHTDVGRRACALLESRGVSTTHLDDPSDALVRETFTAPVDGVAVLLHDDMRALRYSLMIEHVRPGIRLFVAMFDGTARVQLERTVPNCIVLSPAAISVPSMVAAAIAPDYLAIRRSGSTADRSWVTISKAADAPRARIHQYSMPVSLRLRGIIGRLRGQLHPYDSGSSVLLGGVFGLLVIIALDTLVGLRHESLVRALYDATRTTATISSPDLTDESWLLLWAALAAILVMGFTAAFAAGIVHHLLSGRHVALVGRRVMPRSGHVVIAGQGRVGQLLADVFRQQSVPHVAVEHDAELVARLVRKGYAVHFGNAARADLLHKMHTGAAAALVVTMDQPAAAMHTVKAARQAYPDLPIFARSRDEHHARELREAGATAVVPETLEAGLQLSSFALHVMGLSDSAINAALQTERESRVRA